MEMNFYVINEYKWYHLYLLKIQYIPSFFSGSDGSDRTDRSVGFDRLGKPNILDAPVCCSVKWMNNIK